MDLMDLHLPDVVVTHLYNWNPEALRHFLDLHRGKFEYVVERPCQLTLLIARLGQKIQVSAKFVNPDSVYWLNYVLLDRTA
jgi:hypothetical protein